MAFSIGIASYFCLWNYLHSIQNYVASDLFFGLQLSEVAIPENQNPFWKFLDPPLQVVEFFEVYMYKKSCYSILHLESLSKSCTKQHLAQYMY